MLGMESASKGLENSSYVHTEKDLDQIQGLELKTLATQSFDEFCKQNDLSELMFKRSQIKDIHRMIITCFEEFRQENQSVVFTQDKIDNIIKEIGKQQNIGIPRLKKDHVKKAIK